MANGIQLDTGGNKQAEAAAYGDRHRQAETLECSTDDDPLASVPLESESSIRTLLGHDEAEEN